MDRTELSDDAIAAGFRSYVTYWLRGTLEDLQDVYDEIAEAQRTGFPWQTVVDALAKLPQRRLWRAFDDDELQDLYDWASSAGLHAVAAKFAEAAAARPYIDDGKVPPEVRQQVMIRDQRRCRSCGSADNLTIDHKIVPWSDGGSSTDPMNLQVLCRSCNSRKGRRPWSEEA